MAASHGKSGLLAISYPELTLATISLSAVYRVIGSLPTADIDKALKHTLGL